MQSLKLAHNWRSPGLDKLQNFLIKLFSVMHDDLTRAICDITEDPKISVCS